MKRLLIIEDDASIGRQLTEMFEQQQYAVTLITTFKDAANTNIALADLAIVDWHLPDGEGIDLVRTWRQHRPGFPIVLLTARAQISDKLIGLELGANDYVTKPFEPLELAARVKRHLSQADASAAADRPAASVLEAAGIRIDLTAHKAWYNGAPVELSKLQFQLLKYFMEHPGEAFSRDEILNRVWGYNSYPSTRTVDNHVAQLRQLFDPKLFETLHGVGYRFAGGES